MKSEKPEAREANTEEFKAILDAEIIKVLSGRTGLWVRRTTARASRPPTSRAYGMLISDGLQ